MPSPPPSDPHQQGKPRAESEESLPAPDLHQTLHELRVHQLELEMQNEELRRAHAELDLSRARYFDLYDLAPVGYCTLSPVGLVLQANLTLVTLLGLPRGSVVTSAFTRFVHREDQKVLHGLLERVLELGEHQSGELRMAREDGTFFWAQLVVTAVEGESGLPERRVVISDVTPRREAEAARREGELRHRDLFTRASDGILLVTLKGVVVEANQAVARMHGYEPNEMPGLNLQAFDQKRAALEPARLGRMAAGEVLTFEVEHTHRDGHPLSLEVSMSQVSIDGLPRLLAFYRDISERKQVQARLAQTERLASMGMLAAGVAHEINNPLAYVLSNIENLTRELPRVLVEPSSLGGLVEQATAALEGVERIRKISRSLGTFSRVERSGADLVDLNRALSSAAAMANHELKYRAQLVTDFAQLPEVMVSESRLIQVFLNLILNAAQAIDEGHFADNRITLRTWAAGGEVFVEIADTGRGIESENLAHIFEPFFTTRRGRGGTGLGLPICKSIMTELGGDLRVESTPGVGTRIVVQLPLTAKAERSAEIAAPLIPAATRRGRILVVDDEPAIRKMMQRVLGEAHEVVAVTSGLEAKVLLEKDSAFDVILCDVMMPQMTGIELHAWLVSALPSLARRVVFVSGGAFTPNASAYLESVDNRELGKPFDTSELTAVVAQTMAV